MKDDVKELENRLTELSERSAARGIYTNSEFLTLAQQDVLTRLRLNAPYILSGGFDGAERKIAFFGSEDTCGWAASPPIVCLKIAPVSQKFADKLSHRDFLGALMSLGIRRETLGDIVILDNVGYLFCLDSIAGFIKDQFSSVKHTTVTVSDAGSIPEAMIKLPDESAVVISSERLDAVIAAVWKISRSESQKLFEQEKVFSDSRMIKSASFSPAEGSVISVRGFGRFIYEGIERETKKGRLRALVRIYK